MRTAGPLFSGGVVQGARGVVRCPHHVAAAGGVCKDGTRETHGHTQTREAIILEGREWVGRWEGVWEEGEEINPHCAMGNTYNRNTKK